MSINKRVELLISKVANSKSSFSSTTGISTVILSHISSGRNKVSLTAVEQILKAYPKVNADWLVLGTGQMFKDGLESSIIQDFEYKLDTITAELDKHKRSMDVKLNELKHSIVELKT